MLTKKHESMIMQTV